MNSQQFVRNLPGKLKLSQALTLPPTMDYFHRVVNAEFPEIMEHFLRLPEVYVVMVGPMSCCRLLFLRALTKGLAHRMVVYPIASVDFAVGSHLTKLEDVLETIAKEQQPRAIVVNISCVDTLAANDFDSIFVRLKQRYGVLAQVYHRGPLVQNRQASKARFSDLFINLLADYKTPKKQHQINI